MQIFTLLIFVGQSCAIIDSYKDNQDSWYAKELTASEKLKLDQGQTLTKAIETQRIIGQLIITRGNRKYGKYNFIEIGEWKEQYEKSPGNLSEAEVHDEKTYDSQGNILKRNVFEKQKRGTEFYPIEIWESQIQVFNKDTVLTQKIIGLNRDNKIVAELNLAVLNYKEMLSDRLKTKIKIGTEKRFDNNGKLIRSVNYKFEDKEKY